MDDKNRNSGTETNDTEESPQKSSRRRRTPSAAPSDKGEVKSKRRSRSHSRSRSKSSRSRSPSPRARRHRSRSRGHFSPDRRFGRNRGGYRNDFYNRRRRSPSPGYRGGRNRNARRSRSPSFDRYRNRRNTSTSRDRSPSKGQSENRAPQAPPAPNFQTEYTAPHYQAEYPVAQPSFPNPQFGNYDYVPMMQAPPTSFPAYPPPPAQEYMWNAQVPPPPIISCAPTQAEPAPIPAKPISSGPDEEKQKREAAIAAEKKIQRDTIRKQRDDYIRRASALKRELIALKEQREELVTGNEPPSPTTHGFIKENDRLQRIWSLIHCTRLI